MYCLKKELVQQLAKNTELMQAMNCPNSLVLEQELKAFQGIKPKQLTWSEFLDFFFNKDSDDKWWSLLDSNGKKIV